MAYHRKEEPCAPELEALRAQLEEVERARDAAERALVLEALRLATGYVDRAAKLLGWTRRRLQRWMVAHRDVAAHGAQLRTAAGWTGGHPLTSPASPAAATRERVG